MTKINHKKKRKIQSKLLNEYLDFLKDYLYLRTATINIRRLYVWGFLSEIGGISTPSKIHRLSPKIIHDYIVKTTKPMTRTKRKHITSSLRCFLRFGYIKGYLKENLVQAVPVITTRRLDRIPKKISWDDVKRLLTSPDRNTEIGRRDYAILLLLATYGVRIGQVKALTLKDIRWREGIICFDSRKGGKKLSFPLEENAAKALLEYIKKDRVYVPYEKVFLKSKGPKKPFSFNNNLSNSLKVHYRRAGIKSEVKGAHAIRHAFATKLMEDRVPIKTISDLLGHRMIDSTFIYTKVDIERLRMLVRAWPEVEK
ncbi:Tyrosine recombinase XerC [subsurface metagenome]